MLPRLLIALLCAFASPAATSASTLCCAPADACCDESPSESHCPVLPNGECALVAAGSSECATSPAPTVLPALAGAVLERKPVEHGNRLAVAGQRAAPSTTSRLLLLRSFRN